MTRAFTVDKNIEINDHPFRSYRDYEKYIVKENSKYLCKPMEVDV